MWRRGISEGKQELVWREEGWEEISGVDIKRVKEEDK